MRGSLVIATRLFSIHQPCHVATSFMLAGFCYRLAPNARCGVGHFRFAVMFCSSACCFFCIARHPFAGGKWLALAVTPTIC